MSFVGPRSHEEAVLLVASCDLQGEIPSSSQSSFVGGTPRPALPRRTPRCRNCSDKMVHLMQLHAPCYGTKQRYLNTFVCRRSDCAGQPGTVRVFRSQAPGGGAVEPSAEPSSSTRVGHDSSPTQPSAPSSSCVVPDAADDWSGLDQDEGSAWGAPGDPVLEGGEKEDGALDWAASDSLVQAAGGEPNAWGTAAAVDWTAPTTSSGTGSGPSASAWSAAADPSVPACKSPVLTQGIDLAACVGPDSQSHGTGPSLGSDADSRAPSRPAGTLGQATVGSATMGSATKQDSGAGTNDYASAGSASVAAGEAEAAGASHVVSIGQGGAGTDSGIVLPTVPVKCEEEPWEALTAEKKTRDGVRAGIGRGAAGGGSGAAAMGASSGDAAHIEELYQRYLAQEKEDAGMTSDGGGGAAKGGAEQDMKTPKGKGKGKGKGRGKHEKHAASAGAGSLLELLPSTAVGASPGDGSISSTRSMGPGQEEDDSDDDDMRRDWMRGQRPLGGIGGAGRRSTASSVASWRSETAEKEEGPGLAGRGAGGWRTAGPAGDGSTAAGKGKPLQRGARGKGKGKGSSGGETSISESVRASGQGGASSLVTKVALDAFRARVACAPRQLARYAYGGEPLWPAGAPPASSKARPTVIPCRRCGAACDFEVQLLPSLIAEAETGRPDGAPAGLLLGTDFLSVFVWSCSKSCDGHAVECPGEGTGRVVAEEFVWVVPPLGMAARQELSSVSVSVGSC